MLDSILAVLSLLLFAAFLAILGIWVEGTALKVVLVTTVLLAAYDFLRELRSKQPY